jgi:predicted nucleic acid-binding protein
LARYVFDAFALLAYFKDEPGAPRVEEILLNARDGIDQVFMSVVNQGEVLYRLYQDEGREEPADALAVMGEWPLTLVGIDQSLALRASSLKALYRLGYMDCFAAALAEQLDATVVTGDLDFRVVNWFIPIEWLPRDEDQS